MENIRFFVNTQNTVTFQNFIKTYGEINKQLTNFFENKVEEYTEHKDFSELLDKFIFYVLNTMVFSNKNLTKTGIDGAVKVAQVKLIGMENLKLEKFYVSKNIQYNSMTRFKQLPIFNFLLSEYKPSMTKTLKTIKDEKIKSNNNIDNIIKNSNIMRIIDTGNSMTFKNGLFLLDEDKDTLQPLKTFNTEFDLIYSNIYDGKILALYKFSELVKKYTNLN
ncbi:virion protein [Glossina pallidipes salivary gland hypertrophy virus]|uniref:Virion protein n=1 Tax=Glossina hytrovirus (isolate Glossina pallidipes/Ethiopia/Seibersdorf/-) TaxID=379529 RepID=A0A0Y0KBI2_GHVS|nr:virion protein [Glossina pallidipes salivary gland hypertrophy virus]